MNATPLWQLSKSERQRIIQWRETLKTQIEDQKNTIAMLRNNIVMHEQHQKSFEQQLTLLEERYKFD